MMGYRFEKVTGRYLGPGEAQNANECHYTGAFEWDDDQIDPGLVYDDVLQNMRLRTDAEKLPRVKRTAKQALRPIVDSKLNDIYEGLSIGGFQIVRDLYQHIKPNSRDPMSGDLAAAQNLFQAYRNKRQEIDALTTIAEVEAYDLTTDWP